MSRFCFSDIPDISSYVDTILQTVYDNAQSHTTNDGSEILNHKSNNRSVMFSSFNPAICTALNWKQPNCEQTTLILNLFIRVKYLTS